jgi:HD superfamily phosphodiesterase
MIDINAIKTHVISMLGKELPNQLTYHDISHTLDVEEQILIIAAAEGITNQEELEDLQLAALYHDTGFIQRHTNHEFVSCDLARKYLPEFGLSSERIDNICNIIMATKFPHNPHNLLEMIMCDADLDYLGRDDFAETSEKLRNELIAYHIINPETDWYLFQINFFNKHKFFTKTSKEKREAQKMARHNELVKNQINNQK